MSRSMIQGELVEIKSSFEDRTEQVKVDDFLSESCSYKLGPHHVACYSVVSKGAIVHTRNNDLQMTRVELNLVLIAFAISRRTKNTECCFWSIATFCTDVAIAARKAFFKKYARRSLFARKPTYVHAYKMCKGNAAIIIIVCINCSSTSIQCIIGSIYLS